MKNLLLPLLLLVGLVACDGDNSEENVNINFERKAMLENLADNIIVPAYESFDSEINKMVTSQQAFVGNPTESTLVTLRADWQNAYVEWQKVAMFEIGKAEELFFRDFMNSYPTTVNTINVNGSEVKGIRQNVSSASYNLEIPGNRSVQGFPAMDYLLNGLGENDSEIVAFYTTNENATKYKNYLSDITNRMKSLSSQVLASWKSTYRNEFVSKTGSSAGSATDELVNAYVLHFENRIRNQKVAIPSGLRSNSILPDRVEAFYKKDLSKKLLLESLNSAQIFFNGKNNSDETEKSSFASYLKAVKVAKGGEDLASTINANFDNARTQINNLEDNLSNQVNNDLDKMLKTYDALQKNVISLKVDMVQAMDVSINYADADGD